MSVFFEGFRVGVDFLIIFIDYWKKMVKVLRSVGYYFIFVKENFVDKIWIDCFECFCKFFFILGLDYIGIFWKDKVVDFWLKMVERNVMWFVVIVLDEIVWLFNF